MFTIKLFPCELFRDLNPFRPDLLEPVLVLALFTFECIIRLDQLSESILEVVPILPVPFPFLLDLRLVVPEYFRLFSEFVNQHFHDLPHIPAPFDAGLLLGAPVLNEEFPDLSLALPHIEGGPPIEFLFEHLGCIRVDLLFGEEHLQFPIQMGNSNQGVFEPALERAVLLGQFVNRRFVVALFLTVQRRGVARRWGGRGGGLQGARKYHLRGFGERGGHRKRRQGEGFRAGRRMQQQWGLHLD